MNTAEITEVANREFARYSKRHLNQRFSAEIRRYSRTNQRSRLSRLFEAEFRRRRYGATWDESKHPRADDGKFGSGPGSQPGAPPEPSGQKPQSTGEAPQPQKPDKAKWRTDSPTPDFTAIHKAFPPANPNADDTQRQYTQADGSYTPERTALHEKILGGILNGVKKSDDPTLVMMGGGPASGKGSILKTGAITLPENAAHIDPDEIKFQLPEMQEMLHKDRSGALFTHEESSGLSKVATTKARDMGANIVMDGTGDSGFEKLSSKVQGWREKGHKVVAHYVTVDTDEAWKRASSRAKRSGRLVPEEVVRETHAQVSSIFPKAVKAGLFDEFSLWDNNGPEPVKVASGKGTKLTVHSPDAYQRFLAKASQ